MGLITFDTNKSLADLETVASLHGRRSSMVARSQELRKKPLKDFSLEELRSMISKNSSLKYLVPLAIERLQKDPMAKGEGYEGDLLNATLTIEKKFWITDLNSYIPLLNTIVQNAQEIVKSNPSAYAMFGQHTAGAIKIFNENIAHL